MFDIIDARCNLEIRALFYMGAVQISRSKPDYSDLRFFLVFVRSFKGTLGFFLDFTTTKFLPTFKTSLPLKSMILVFVRKTAKKEAATCPETSLPLCPTSPLHITQIPYTFCVAYILTQFASSILILRLLKFTHSKTLSSEDKRKRLCFNTGTCPPNCTASLSGHNNL